LARFGLSTARPHAGCTPNDYGWMLATLPDRQSSRPAPPSRTMLPAAGIPARLQETDGFD